MSRKFVRNITDTKLSGEKKEPLKTNVQNDLLSDDEDVFIRNKKEYHCLTDNLKEITVPKNNNTIQIKRTSKNSIELIGNKQDIPNIPDLKDYAKKQYVDEKIEKIEQPEISFRLDDNGDLYYKVDYKE